MAATGLWLLALICSFTWVQEFQSEFFIATLGFLFAAMAVNDASGIERREWKYPVSPVLIAGGLFWAVAAISLAASDILFTSWIYFFFLSILPLSIIFFLVGNRFDQRLEQARRGIIFVLSLLALYALYQYFFLPKFLYKGRVHEPLTDPNGLAAVFSIGIFLAAEQILKNKSRLYGVAFFLLTCGFFTTGSRGAFLSIAIAGMAFIGFAGARSIGWKKLGFLSVVIGMAFIAIGLIYAPLSYSGPLNVLLYTLNLGFDGVFNERGLIWDSSWELVKAQPFLGTGPGTFSFYYPEFRQVGDMTAGLMAHNDPLQFAVEMGILSTVLFYTVCGFVIFRTVEAIKKIPDDQDIRLSILIPFCALAAFVLHAHVTFNFYVLPGLMLAGFLFALWYRATALVLGEKWRDVTAPVYLNDFSLKAIFMIVTMGMTVLVAAPIYSQRLVASAQEDLQNGHLPAFAKKIDTANSLSLGTNVDAYILAANIPLGILDQSETPVSETDRSNFIAQAESLLTRAEKANERDADIYMLRSQLAKIRGDEAQQISMLEKTLRLNPAHMKARIALADYLEAEGRLEEAAKLMNEGIDIKYSRDDAMQYLNFYLKAKAMEAQLDEARAKSSGKVP